MESPQIAVDPSCTNCTERSPKELSHDLFWGLGWGIAHSDRGDILWHWGDNGAFKCFVAINPRQKKGVVFFTDSENGLAIAEEIMRIALAADPPIFHWLKYDSYDSTAMRFSVAVREKGATAAIAEFTQDLKAGTISEDSLNSAGFRLLRQKKSEDAIQVFELNVQLHPNSANAYDSLGEAYMDKNDVSRAISNYERSLQLNPNNNNAVEMLKKLRSN